MPDLRPAYLIHGEDHGRIAERRARLRTLAQEASGAAGVEVLEGERATPAAVAAALAATTLAFGRRIVIVDGAERFSEADVRKALGPALASLPPDTTIAFFAREEGRSKAPAALHELVRAAGGEIAAEATVKPWELPRWVRDHAARMGLEMDAEAARSLIAIVGERQQRLLRELERLVLEHGDDRRIEAGEIERDAAYSTHRRVFELADAILAGDVAQATAAYVSLDQQGERLGGLLYWMAQRVREAHDVALRLDAGESPAQLRRGLRMPPRAAERFLADVARTDPRRLARAVETLADLELDTRGGSGIAGAVSRESGGDPGHRRHLSALEEQTQVLLALAELEAG